MTNRRNMSFLTCGYATDLWLLPTSTTAISSLPTDAYWGLLIPAVILVKYMVTCF